MKEQPHAAVKTLREIQSAGGRNSRKNMSPEESSAVGRKNVQARWKEHIKNLTPEQRKIYIKKKKYRDAYKKRHAEKKIAQRDK